MIEWKRIKAGTYESNNGRFNIFHTGPDLWILRDGNNMECYEFVSLRDSKMGAEWIIDNER